MVAREPFAGGHLHQAHRNIGMLRLFPGCLEWRSRTWKNGPVDL